MEHGRVLLVPNVTGGIQRVERYEPSGRTDAERRAVLVYVGSERA